MPYQDSLAAFLALQLQRNGANDGELAKARELVKAVQADLGDLKDAASRDQILQRITEIRQSESFAATAERMREKIRLVRAAIEAREGSDRYLLYATELARIYMPYQGPKGIDPFVRTEILSRK